MIIGVTCTFPEGSNGEYAFKTMLEDIKVGDYLVADTQNGYQIVKVASWTWTPSKKATRWAFGKVDIAKLDECKSIGAKYDSIIGKLDQKVAAIQTQDRYLEIARHDPEAAKLLEELQGITKIV